MEQNYVQIRKMAEARLLGRALEDPAFRELLLKDPQRAFQEELGVAFPADAKLQIVQEAPDTMILVVPAAPPKEGELSDAQLGSVAGGLSGSDIWAGIKRIVTGGQKFEVETERAVAGVRG